MGLLSLDDTPLGAPDGRVAALGAQDGSSASLDAALRAQVRCLTASHRLRVCRFAVLRVIHRDWPCKISQCISLWCSTLPRHLRDQRGWSRCTRACLRARTIMRIQSCVLLVRAVYKHIKLRNDTRLLCSTTSVINGQPISAAGVERLRYILPCGTSFSATSLALRHLLPRSFSLSSRSSIGGVVAQPVSLSGHRWRRCRRA